MKQLDRVARDGAAIIAALEPVPITYGLPEVETVWRDRLFQFHQRSREALERGDHNAAQRWTWCAGVATDKLTNLKDRPTAGVVTHLHLHRHELSPALDRLASIMRGPAPVVERVVHSHSVGSKSIQVIEPRYDAPLTVIDAGRDPLTS